MKAILVKNQKKKILKKINEFCICDNITGTYSDTKSSNFGYQDICANCNKKIEDVFRYYNHYDSQYHDDINIY